MHRHPAIAVASLVFGLDKPGEDGRLYIQVTPDGEFRASDGRPEDVPAWRMSAANAQLIISRHAARQTPVVIDYEHQTLYKEKNGQPAPAAAWFQSYEYQPGKGLFAWVKLTARAASMIAAEELLFFSPVFAYDKAGNVIDVQLGAFTNTPGIDGMDALAALTAAAGAIYIQPTQEEAAMEKTLLAALCALLGLADNASAEDVTTAITQLKTDKDSEVAKVAALTAQVGAAPDPSKFVPIGTFNDLQAQVAALTKTQTDQAVDALVALGEEDCKVTAASRDWFRGFAAKDIEGARAWLKDAPVIAALTRMQSGGHRDVPNNNDIGDPVKVAALARKYQDDQRAVGVEISTAAAVAHVTQQKEA